MQKRTQNKAETPAIHFNERVDDDFPIHIMRNYLETKRRRYIRTTSLKSDTASAETAYFS